MNAYEIDTRHWLAAHAARLAVQGKTKHDAALLALELEFKARRVAVSEVMG